MTDQIAPCPFCNGKAAAKVHAGTARTSIPGFSGARFFRGFIKCTNCGAMSQQAKNPKAMHDAWNRRALPPAIRDFLGKMQGVCMGVAMSGRDHPNPDGALMGLFNEAQAILFPGEMKAKGGDRAD